MNPVRRRRRTDQVWDFLSLVALTIVVIIVGMVLTIYVNPDIQLNPFPPPALPEQIILPSPTNLQVAQLSPTATKDAGPLLTITPETESTVTPAWQITPTQPAGTIGTIRYDFELRGSASGISASQYDSSRTCDWFGVAGKVEDLQGTPVRGIRVRLQGVLDNRQIDLVSMSGTDLKYGSAGFEFFLGDKPLASNGQLTAQLVDQAGLPLSAKISLDTYSDCDKNLIWLDFIEVR